MARVNVNQSKKILLGHKLLGPHVRKTSNQIIRGARSLAPQGSHLSGSGNRRPGQSLRASLTIDSAATVNTITERVGSRVNYAATVHQGSQQHIIQARGKLLKFRWDRGDMLVQARHRGRIPTGFPRRSKNGFFYFLRVRHPGNKRPVRYLTTPMVMYGRMNGFAVSTNSAGRSRLP